MKLDWIQIVTLIIAMVGAVLGLVNTWRTFSNDRVRVRVKPAYSLLTDGSEFLSIEVINLSTFAVTVTSFGFTVRGGSANLFMPDFRLSTPDSLPKRVEPRESFAIFLRPGGTFYGDFEKAELAFVTLASGERPTSTAHDLAAALHNLNLGRLRDSANA